ncbi:asparagine synthase C-terminal domain-containing protein [Haloprofundus salilacus]|uniref:asparagine synthase C-terminal domain-containing protein n=1 Tax=Haloprofundus salilacus TaxID=2876190 RepID=UPI001CCA88D1|nr:asparagine synthase-related protein [Haloprofundus salilacus]
MRGSSPERVVDALDEGDPLPGTGGFAGRLDANAVDPGDGGNGSLLVRDVLGRQPLFFSAIDPATWSFDPTDLDDPKVLPAGHVRRLTPTDASASSAELDVDKNESKRAWTLPEPPIADDAAALDAVRDAVLGSVRTIDTSNTAVAFSGGVDSALVAAGISDAPCYVAGFEGSHDVAAARDAAEAMDRDLRVVEFTHDDLTRAVPEIVRATGRTNAMDVQIALPLYLAAERVAADGYERLAVGQGADELFGGYAKVANAPDDHRVNAETVRGATREVVATLPEQLERDVLTLRAAGVEPVAPLLHDDVVAAALGLPGHLLTDGEERKIALRRAAEGVIPDDIAAADKKAVQYGSLAARELDRLARRAGFKRRMDDHVGQYVCSLVDSRYSWADSR